MMRLFLFNPDHDMALAANCPAYVAKRAGRELARDMAWLPVAYAASGDAVLLPDDAAEPPLLVQQMADSRGVAMVRTREMGAIAHRVGEICPWGWNRQIAHRLRKHCPSLVRLLPADDYLRMVRLMSSRQYAAEHVLRPLHESAGGLFVGEAVACRTEEELLAVVASWPAVVAKEPWSGSGRGLRYIKQSPDAHQLGWCRRVIATQGCLMVEPHYRKVADLAAEFHIDGNGHARYCGCSLFLTRNGQYQGNIIAGDSWRRDFVGRLVPHADYERAVELLLPLIATAYRSYRGPLGVDMMVVEEGGHRLHPCVEVNLRQTMGRLALSFPWHKDGPILLRINGHGGYRLELVPYTDGSESAKDYW